jgi:hypothetical protein
MVKRQPDDEPVLAPERNKPGGHPAALVEQFPVLGDPDWRARCAAGRAQDIEPGLLAALAADADYAVRHVASRHPALPVMLLAQLAADPNPEVRQHIAMRPQIAPEVQQVCAQDPDKENRYAMLKREHVAPEALRILASPAEMPYIRIAAIRHPDCPPDVHLQSARDPQAKIRYWVANHTGAPRDLLEQLAASDPDPRVAKRARQNLDGTMRPLTPSERRKLLEEMGEAAQDEE